MDEKQKNLFGERDAVLASLSAEEKIIDDELVSARKRIRNAEDDIDVLNARKKSLQRAVLMISNLVPDGEKTDEKKEPETVVLSSKKKTATLTAPKEK